MAGKRKNNMSTTNDLYDDELSDFEQNQNQQQQDTDDDLPEKYRGKSAKDIAKMHLELEKLYGKHTEEVAFARKMAEEAVKRTTGQPQPEVKKADVDDLEDVDFFADPKAAVNKAVSMHPEVIRAREMAAEMQRQQSQAKVRELHPDVDNVISDPDFAQWVQGNRARMMLLKEADRNFDAEAADELLSNYKAYKGSQQGSSRTEELRQNTRQQLRAAQTDSGAGFEASGKKIYRRQDIRELMLRDPERYEAMSDEIMLAYAEGRVK
jgi:hypothetical protein